MNIQKTLIASMIVVTCMGMAASPASFAQGQGGGAAMSVQRLSSTEVETLRFMREEEKLARDVYITLHNQWGLAVFNNISQSEQKHTDRIKALLQTYGVADPVTNDTVGVFQDSRLLGLYTQLVAQGQKSMLDALYVGAFIEETDISDLQGAIAGTTHADIANTYSNLMKGSRNHLRAFVGLIEGQGIDYAAQALPQAEVDAIANSEAERGNINAGGRGRR